MRSWIEISLVIELLAYACNMNLFFKSDTTEIYMYDDMHCALLRGQFDG